VSALPVSLWTQFLHELRQPEYVHVLLNPLPIYGLAAGFLSLVLAWAARSRAAQAVALGLILLAALAAWPVAHFGREAYDRVYAMSGQPAQHWLDWHAYLAERIVWVHYAAAALAVGALLCLWRVPRWQRLSLALTLAATLVAIGLGGFLAFVGGKIRHSEFRDGPPPVIVRPESADH
jgi:uncharacterized membrane protein